MKMTKTANYIFLFLLIIYGPMYGQSVVNSAHNLSVGGSGSITASSETEICIFCHTPHNSSPRTPLWNREDPGVTYTLYSSSTIQAEPGQPDGASILCLSCHDGTIALGSVLSRTEVIELSGGISTLPAGRSNLSTDLSDDHPISFIYNSGLAASDGELKDPASISGPIHLENERLQCTACHDPHKNDYQAFLRVTNQYSDLCLECHQKDGWENASHKLSTATWNGSGTNPWPHTSFSTVNENGCENCHRPHSANGNQRLTNYLFEQDNCVDCHNAAVAEKDILTDLGKEWKHNLWATDQVHDPGESLPVQNRHVECIDCHNPHKATDLTAAAPYASGKISGVPGIDSDGNQVNSIQYEYELCYKCHADSPDKPESNISRDIMQSNTRLEYDLGNPSFHPVEGPGNNSDVPSLIDPYTESSVIYCSDCHSSNNSDANGPHGSDNYPLLKYNYETTDYTTVTYQAYELCFQCHDYNSIVTNESSSYAERVHKTHIDDARTPCSVCHDAHGINADQGNSTNNSHLINFDTNVVEPSRGTSSRLEFVDNGNFQGACYLFCHNRNHNPRSY